MGIRRGGAGTALAIVIGTAIWVVPAATAGSTVCAEEFANLRTATEDATYTSRRAAMDEQGLLDKISAAEQKAGRNKTDDAVAKLMDYEAKVTTLEGSAKLRSEVSLVELADRVVLCLVPAP